MKIAITTASGQLGQATIGALQGLDAGHEIIGLARTPAKAQGLGIEIRPGDYDAPDQLHASLNGIDVVFLI
jgi:NAD(P)H dehydrogenase (quinone)